MVCFCDIKVWFKVLSLIAVALYVNLCQTEPLYITENWKLSRCQLCRHWWHCTAFVIRLPSVSEAPLKNIGILYKQPTQRQIPLTFFIAYYIWWIFRFVFTTNLTSNYKTKNAHSTTAGWRFHRIWVTSQKSLLDHKCDVIMTAMASQIPSLTIDYSTVYSGSDQRKHQSSASLAFCGEFTGDRRIPRTKGQ